MSMFLSKGSFWCFKGFVFCDVSWFCGVLMCFQFRWWLFYVVLVMVVWCMYLLCLVD